MVNSSVWESFIHECKPCRYSSTQTYRPSVSQLSLVTKYGGLLCPMLWLICALWSKGPMAFRKWFSVWFSALLISFSFSHENVKHKPKSQLSWSKFMIDSSFFIFIFIVCFFFSAFFLQICVSWVSSCLKFNMKIAFDANDVQRMKSKRLMGVERSCHLLTKRFATNSVFGIIAVNRYMGRWCHLKHVVTLIRTLKFFFTNVGRRLRY